MNTRTFHLARRTLAWALLLSAPSFALAEPPPGTPEAGPLAGPSTTPAESATVLRERIERRVEGLREAEKRLQEALAKLNEGTDPAEVRRLLEVQAGRGLLQGFGPNGPPRRPEGAGEGGTQPGPQEPSPPLRGGRTGPSSIPTHGADELWGGASPWSLHEGSRGEPLSADERERAKAVIAAARPSIIEAHEQMRRENPQMAERVWNALSGRLRGIEQLQTADPALFELKLDEIENGLAIMRQTRVLFDARQSGDQARIQRERRTLGDLLSKQFDARAKAQATQIEHLETKLAKMKAELAEATSRKGRFIDRRLNEMTPQGERGKDAKTRPDGASPRKP
ncbi:MAG: hypothetical protein ACKVS8_06395 [Phycisphaerales bacterium]